MSTPAVPLALGAAALIVFPLIVIVLAALIYELLGRGNRRQAEVDEEREHVAEQVGFRDSMDFESDLRPPRDP
jgi:hypothetical protein